MVSIRSVTSFLRYSTTLGKLEPFLGEVGPAFRKVVEEDGPAFSKVVEESHPLAPKLVE